MDVTDAQEMSRACLPPLWRTRAGIHEPHDGQGGAPLSRNFNFDTNVMPPEYVISFPCNVNVSASTFRDCKYDSLLTITCNQSLTSELCRSLYPDDLAARLGEKAVDVAVIAEVGVAVIGKLTERERARITDLEHDVSVQCGIPFVLVNVQVDLLRNRLHVYAPKHCATKALRVAQYRVDLAKA